MSSFNWRKNIEDSLKDGLIITIGATGIFSGLKASNIKPPEASRLNAMDIITLTGGICVGVFMKDYAVYRKWINEQYNKKFYNPYRVIKLTQHLHPKVTHIYAAQRFNS